MTIINNHDLERIAKAFLEICYKETTDQQKIALMADKLWHNLEMEETSNYTDTCVYVYTSKENIKRHRDLDELEVKYNDKRDQLIKLKQTLTECMEDIHMANNLR
tara:strand:+ start:117 stop:431 length:315 start_codon:yes stop_codon:yes gene_type:complete